MKNPLLSKEIRDNAYRHGGAVYWHYQAGIALPWMNNCLNCLTGDIKMLKTKFILTDDSYSEEVDRLKAGLVAAKVPTEEITRAELLLEEVFYSFAERKPDGCSAIVIIQKRFGDVNLQLTVQGEGFNPIIENSDWAEDDGNYLRGMILTANREYLSYARKNGNNIITIRVHRISGHPLRNVVLAIILGIATGYALQNMLDPSLVSDIDYLLVKTVQGMFMDALGMMAAPMIFSAIVLGITEMTDASDVGRIAGKFAFISFLMLGVSSLVCMIIGLAFFPGDMSEMLAAIPKTSNGGTAQAFSLRGVIVGIVPKNLVIPFTGQNILQTLFLAVFSGIIMNKMGAKAQIAKDIVDFLNKFATEVMNVIVRFIPLVVYLSMISLVLNSNLNSILSIGKVIIGVMFFIPIFWAIASVFILFWGKASPLPFVKKYAAFSPLPFSTNSSNTTLPNTLKLASEKLGIEPKLALFTIPVGIQITSAGTCADYVFCSIMMARVYGIELTTTTLMTLIFTTVLMSAAKPPIPGGSIICMGAVFASIGIPIEAVSLVLCINPVTGMFNTVTNVCCDTAATLVLALTEKMTDLKTYMADV